MNHYSRARPQTLLAFAWSYSATTWLAPCSQNSARIIDTLRLRRRQLKWARHTATRRYLERRHKIHPQRCAPATTAAIKLAPETCMKLDWQTPSRAIPRPAFAHSSVICSRRTQSAGDAAENSSSESDHSELSPVMEGHLK